MSTAPPYHHGNLRDAAVKAAVAEVARVGPTAVSLREVARLAGVSHAAIRYQFGDKAGLFTAVAIEGFEAIAAWSAQGAGEGAILEGGLAYVEYAVGDRGHFDVMFRPDLFHADDPDLVRARELAFASLYTAAAESAGPGEPSAALALAGWSMAHGIATLRNAGNLELLDPDPDEFRRELLEGLVQLGQVAGWVLGREGSTGSGTDQP